MNNKVIFSLFLALSGMSALFGQGVVQISIADVIAPDDQTEICVPVVADSFPNIASMGFSLRWDSTQLLFTRLNLDENPLGITSGTFSEPDAASLVISQLMEGLRGITLAPGTTMMELCFMPQMTDGSTPIEWRGINPAEFVQEGAITAFPAVLNPGSVTYGSSAALVVRPGDTNGDDQVDHRDILNIGIANGASGPSRQDATDDFTQQVVAPWNQQTLGGVNYANVDTDGNGSITLNDTRPVGRNFGQAVTGFVEPADVSAAGGPSLRFLPAAATTEAGMMATATIALGNGSDPTAIGYGLSFTIDYDPTLIEGSLRVSTDGGFLDGESVTFTRESTTRPGRLYVTITRTDGSNWTTPGGNFLTLNYTPLSANNQAQTDLTFTLTPNAFVLNNGSAAPINGGSGTVTVEGNVAVTEPVWGRELRIFPNPYTTGPLTVSGDLPAFGSVSLYTPTGRLLRTFAGDARQLNLTDLPAGSYLLRVQIGTERVTRRIVKQ